VTYTCSPAASVPDAFARAITGPGGTPPRTSPRTQSVTLTLSQNFEGKGRPDPDDTLGLRVRKLKLLSVVTGGITYDFEQAKLPGRTGWATDALTNQLISDLVPGFSLNIAHDLWEGEVGTDTARFRPFLQNVSTQFSITENTLHSIGSLLGLVHGPARAEPNTQSDSSPRASTSSPPCSTAAARAASAKLRASADPASSPRSRV